MRNIIFTLVAAICVLSIGNSYAKGNQKINKKSRQIVSFMEGEFNSNVKRTASSDGYNAALNVAPMFTERKTVKGNWIFVEPASNSSAFGQRVYNLAKVNDSITVCAVYNLPAGNNLSASINDDKAMASISPKDFELKNASQVFLVYRNEDGELSIGGAKGKVHHTQSSGNGMASDVRAINTSLMDGSIQKPAPVLKSELINTEK
ncbi:MAG: hypothetical protein RJA07_2588 [Bacteroidota bacterium]